MSPSCRHRCKSRRLRGCRPDAFERVETISEFRSPRGCGVHPGAEAMRWAANGGGPVTSLARRPFGHQQAALLEQIAASISGLDLAFDRVRQRHLDYVARVVRVLGRPIAERGSEAMRGQIIATHATKEHKHRHIAERLGRVYHLETGTVRAAPFASSRRSATQVPTAYAMLNAAFCPPSRHGPNLILDLVRRRSDHFAGTRGR
jgi:hypothetical protein